MRCLLLDGTGPINHWPERGSIIFNDTNIYEFQVAEDNPARSDNALNVTTLIDKGRNTISVLKYHDYRTFAAGVFLIRQTSEDMLIDKLKN